MNTKENSKIIHNAIKTIIIIAFLIGMINIETPKKAEAQPIESTTNQALEIVQGDSIRIKVNGSDEVTVLLSLKNPSELVGVK